jgi:CO/xanthine dehydrogenase Mo-binding subunit
VLEIPQGVAVLAEGHWQARRAASLLDITWEAGPFAGMSSDQLRWKQIGTLRQPQKAVVTRGDAAAALQRAAVRARGVYEVPLVAHAAMEPLNATAEIKDGVCTVWAGNQAPSLVKAIAARITQLPHEDIHVVSTLMGGGFGRRGLPDFTGEAVELAWRTKRPVQVVWTREDDTRHDQYRPSAMALFEGGVDGAGAPVAWLHRMTAQSLIASYTGFVGQLQLQMVPKPVLDMLGDMGALFVDGHLIDPTAVEGADHKYRVKDARVEVALVDSGLPVSAWRSVGHSINGFMVESFIDELAHAARADPLSFRVGLLDRAPRERAVLEACARAIGWSAPAPRGRFRGIAQHACFGSFCAQAVELSVDNGLRVHRVVSAIDCGRVVNPDLVAAQMESGVIYGLSAALDQRIDIEKGAVVQSNFHDHPLLRMNEAPRVDTVIVPSEARPTGVGELAVPPIAAALGNALFAATGVRLRRLPMRPDVELVLAGRRPEEVPA